MTTPVVRPYQESDHDAVVALWAKVFPDEPMWNQSEGLIQLKLTVQPELFFVCLVGEELVGTTIAGFDGVRGWVHKVGASPEHRRLGIARELMRAAEDGLAKLGCHKLNLQVRAGNERAIAFYREAGYQFEDRVSMSKHIGTTKHIYLLLPISWYQTIDAA